MRQTYFTDYQSPSSMCKKSSETENTEINKTRVNLIKKGLTKLKRIIANTAEYDAAWRDEDWREWKDNRYCWKASWA